MKKVYQTIVDRGNGNCMQAVVASLFEKELDEVPHFLEAGDKCFTTTYEFFREQGYDITPFNPKKEEMKLNLELLEYDNGINGFFYATVLSQTFKDGTHAVVIDKNLNVVHDPNPNKKALKLKPEDIISFWTHREDWYVSNGKLIKEKWKTKNSSTNS